MLSTELGSSSQGVRRKRLEDGVAREIERLLNDHDDTYAHMMPSLEKRLDAKSDLMMRKLDEISNGRNREKRPLPREDSRHSTARGL